MTRQELITEKEELRITDELLSSLTDRIGQFRVCSARWSQITKDYSVAIEARINNGITILHAKAKTVPCVADKLAKCYYQAIEQQVSPVRLESDLNNEYRHLSLGHKKGPRFTTKATFQFMCPSLDGQDKAKI